MSIELRTIQRHERDAVLDLLKEWLNDRAFFARYFEHDAEFRDDRCFVAVDQGRIVSTLQIFRKPVRFNDVVLEVGGIGNVFTTASYRERHLASQLLGLGIQTMEDQGFDLSLLFAVRLKFYSSFGWESTLRHLVYLPPSTATLEAGYDITAFAPEDLGAVRDVYESYNRGRRGPVVRDQDYWNGQLRYAGNPDEHFLVARRDGELAAYARGTTLYDFFVIIEHGYLPGHRAALTQLIVAMHTGPAAALPGTLTHLGIEPAVCSDLEALGVSTRVVEDVFWMWRVISPEQVARKLGVTVAEVQHEDFFRRLLPAEDSVYWLADRF